MTSLAVILSCVNTCNKQQQNARFCLSCVSAEMAVSKGGVCILTDSVHTADKTCCRLVMSRVYARSALLIQTFYCIARLAQNIRPQPAERIEI